VTDSFHVQLDRLLTERDLSIRAFADQVGVAWSFVHRVRKGTKNPPLTSIQRWADTLSLTGQARERFIDAAHWSHVPVAVRPWLLPRMKRIFE